MSKKKKKKSKGYKGYASYGAYLDATLGPPPPPGPLVQTYGGGLTPEQEAWQRGWNKREPARRAAGMTYSHAELMS